jgi:WD40 repeat protein
VSTQQQVAELRGHTSQVTSVAFDLSGKYLASGSSDKTVRIWDVSTQPAPNFNQWDPFHYT